MYKSQYGQDSWVHENYFADKKDGVFLDIGAHDGETLSNTWFFEKELGWVGYCFEPIPAVYEKLIKKRSCYCENVAVWKEDCSKLFTIIDGYSEMLSGITESCPMQHQQRINGEVQQFQQKVTQVDVKCRSINSILAQMNTPVDFLSIDVEGAEYDILSAINFEKYSINVIDCENNYEDFRIREFLANRGFAFVARLGIDDIFAKKIS